MLPPVVRIRAAIDDLVPYDGGPGFEEFADRFGARGIAMLAGNEYPTPPFPEVLGAIAAAAAGIHRYPDAGTVRLREALAEALGITPDCVWPGAGSSENLTTTARAVGGPGTSIVYPWPSFAMYPINAVYADAESIRVPLDEALRIDLGALYGAIRDDTTLVIICNPNNPTGSYVTRAEIHEFADRVPESVLVLVDEAYGEFVAAEEESSIVPLAVGRPNVVVARTFSKIYGLAGLRVGYMVGQAPPLRSRRKAQSPFVGGSLAEVAATTALRFPERVRERFDLNRRGVDYLEGALSDRGIRYVPTQANFIWLRLGPGTPGIVQELLEMGTLIRKGTEDWTRVSVGTESENRRFVEDLDLVLRRRRS
ncbi:MAG: aminotransferase class I/II-fold pyridoxal phosphate-dependent enzyme [Acidimicrobiia bacterium]|nr:aminotransferase class I/II-fold pyridoxal phosphate-dependent enzyme [Acidimicrobiia bacterium]